MTPKQETRHYYFTEPDHPHVRATTVCASCQGNKDIGLLVCWPCHRGYKREGYPAAVIRTLDQIEAHCVLHDRFGPRSTLAEAMEHRISPVLTYNKTGKGKA